MGASPRGGLAAAHDELTRLGFAGAMICLLGIVVSFSYEVIARYFFSAPTVWASPLVSYLVCAMIFLAAPELTRQRAHIVINLVLDRLSPARLAFAQRAIRLIAATACFFAAWFSADASWSQFQQGIETVSYWPVKKWIVSAVIPYGLASSGLHFLRQMISNDTPLAASGGIA